MSMAPGDPPAAADAALGPPSIGLIGYGAIGRALVARLSAEAPQIRWHLLLRAQSQLAGPLPGQVRRVADLQGLIAARPLAVVEAAGAEAARAALPGLLRAGLAVIPASVGALADRDFADGLAALAARHAGRLIVPGGALGGLDYLAAIAPLADARLVYTSRKPPAAWRAELVALGVDPEGLGAPYLLFEGPADRAAQAYPRNLNAGLTLALTLGHGRVRVRVLADPAARGNSHEITVDSAAGQAQLCFVNAPDPDNPKTSALTALSIAAALRPLIAAAYPPVASPPVASPDHPLSDQPG